MKYISKYWLLAIAILFLVFKMVGILWTTIDLKIAAGELPVHMRNMRFTEIAILIISLSGLFIKTKAGFTFSMLYSFVAIEYGVIYDLIITHNTIGNTIEETIASMGVGIIALTLIVLNQQKKRETGSKDIQKGILYSSLVSLPIMLFLAYGYLLT